MATKASAFGSASVLCRFYSVLLVVLVCCGCRTSSLTSFTKPHGPLVQLNLITSPVALDFDRQPGPDGISVKVYANAANNPKTVPIREGSLELLLFDGSFRGTNIPPVLREFRFEPGELRLNEFTSNIGAGYNFLLPWGTNLPTQRIMSVAARYTSPSGAIVTSRPSSVTVLSQ